MTLHITNNRLILLLSIFLFRCLFSRLLHIIRLSFHLSLFLRISFFSLESNVSFFQIFTFISFYTHTFFYFSLSISFSPSILHIRLSSNIAHNVSRLPLSHPPPLSSLLFTRPPFLPRALLYFPTLLLHARSRLHLPARLCPRAPSTPYRVLLVELYAPHPSDRSHIHRAITPPLFPPSLISSLFVFQAPHTSSMSDDAQAYRIFFIPSVV